MSIESIVIQDFTDWELILVNDGSTDNTLAICKTYACSDERISVVDQENRGVVEARHSGFLRSSGSIILFLDSDDKLYPQALHLVNKVFAKENCDLLRFGFEYCSSNWEPYKSVLPEIEGPLNRSDLMERHLEPLKHYASPSIWDKAYSRDLLKRVFSRIGDVKIAHSEDMLFSLYAVALSRSLFFLPIALYGYRQREGSAIHSLNRTALEDKQVYIDYLNRLLDELPASYHVRVRQLILVEATEAVGYIMNNAVFYSNDFDYVRVLARRVRVSRFYREHVRFKNRTVRHAIQDVLLIWPTLYTVVVFFRDSRLRAKKKLAGE